ncbi:Signal recognition particle 54 kDa protein [uncultured archaeon]|nr:Signal recognition particle 54 kDa protein [uncultured archaeon]
MNQGMLFDQLKNPKFYGPHVTSVQLLQTHISYVALTGTYAYKVKKPVNFGFLDFSTLDKRKYFCEEELRLNKRLCPDMYLDVLPITQKDNTLELDGDGTIVEYVLKMKEFPQEYIMTNMLQQAKISEETIDHLCTILVDFYDTQEPLEEIKKYGELQAVKQNIDENFNQTKPMIDFTISKEMYWYVKEATTKFFERKKEVFGQRIKEGKIYDCHGDLHSGNIIVTGENIHIFDCIEFNDRFRFCDVASDIGFLSMDLDYLNYPYLSSYLIQKYVEKSRDINIYSVLNFYKSYRAFVRGKVYGFQLNDPHINPEKKGNLVETAQKYFDLSRYYTELFLLDLQKSKPLLFLVTGLTGTGKSTIARKIAVDYHAAQINTDVVRKEIAGIDKFEQHHDQFNTGLYDPKKIDDTYEKVMEQAAKFLKKKENVVLDATFQKKKYRDMMHHIAAKYHATLVRIQCVCPDDVVKKRLEDRLRKKSISDGRWEIYLQQKTTFDPFSSEEDCLTMDTSDESYEYRMSFFRLLLSHSSKVI